MMYWKESIFGGGYMQTPFFFWGLSFWVVWDIAWKGLAMWRAARRKEPVWFVALMLINSVGLLPIAYLLIWGKEDGDEKVFKSVVSKVKAVKKKKK